MQQQPPFSESKRDMTKHYS